MDAPRRHPASFRDPDATIHLLGQRVLRGLSAAASARYDAIRATGLLDALEGEGLVVATRDAPGLVLEGRARTLEHDVLAFVSHPYEWPFTLLKRAAILHLDVHLRALDHGVTLTDASAYNVQFRGTRPVFIDIGSFRQYREGELWAAHRQYCEQFLNPLLLAARFGIPYHAWYRGAPNGIPSSALAALWPARGWLSPRELVHVLLPARAEAGAPKREGESMARIKAARMPREGYRAAAHAAARLDRGARTTGFRLDAVGGLRALAHL